MTHTDTSFSVTRTRQGQCPLATNSHHVPTIKTVPDADAEDDATVALPPVQQDFADAQSTTISSTAAVVVDMMK
jgi:hypothetical protein